MVVVVKVALMDSCGADCAAGGFWSTTLNERLDTPLPMAFAMMLDVVTVTKRVPVPCDQLPESVDVDVPATLVTAMLPVDKVVLPVRPLTVSTGLHDEKSGTFTVRDTVIVFESQGKGELCNTLHIELWLLRIGVLMNMALPSDVLLRAAFATIHPDVWSDP